VRSEATGIETDIIRFAEIDSTNAEALRQANAGQHGPAWVLASSQNQGRGRHGRHWSSQEGGLFATYLLVLNLPLQTLLALTFVASVAVHQTAQAHTPAEIGPDLTLKWPNDLLADGRKIAGILIQTEPLGGGKTAIAIGIGLNVANDLQDASVAATSLSQLGGTHTVEAVFTTLAQAMAEQMLIWNRGQGVEKIFAAWQSRAMANGTATQVRLPHGKITGTYAGLDPTGGLRLRLASGDIQVIHAGDVVFAPPQTEPGAHP